MSLIETTTPSTCKVRRIFAGGKRGNGNYQNNPIRRPDPRKICIKGGADSLTSVAGLAMFGRFLRSIELDSQLCELFDDMKHPKLTVYPMQNQLRLLIDLFAAGEGRVFGLEYLASDPLFVHLAGGVVPSIDTVYRDLDRFNRQRVERLHGLMVQQGLVAVSDLAEHTEVHLDIDTTALPLFGTQIEGSAIGYNPKYHGRYSYHPIVARCAETSTCVGAQLRAGNTSFGNNETVFVRECIEQMRKAIGPKPLLYVRIDSAADCTEIMKTIHDTGSIFITKAKMNHHLYASVWAHTKWKTIERDADALPTRQVAEIPVRRKEWGSSSKLPVRVIAVRTSEREKGKLLYLWDEVDMSVQVYLTNDPNLEPDELARKYDGRAGIEPQIAEFKNGWSICAMSTDTFWGNAAMLLLKLLTHNMLQRYVESCTPAVRQWRVNWIRRMVIWVPGRIVVSGRRTYVHVPSRPAYSSMLN